MMAAAVAGALALAGCAGGGGGGGGGDDGTTAGPTPITGLIGVDANGTIYGIDKTNGDGTALGDSGISSVEAMAYESGSGRLFAGTGGGTVYTVDRDTRDAATFPLDDGGAGITGSGFAYSGMAVHPTSGEVYVVSETECSLLISFDPSTGAATQQMDTGTFPDCFSRNGEGLPIVFTDAGDLYFSGNYNNNGEIYLLDISGVSSNLIGTFSYSGFPTARSISTTFINSMARDPSDGTIFVSLTSGELATIDWSDPRNIVVTYVGTLPTVLRGLTFVTP